ncbi:MAG TPA: sigma-70 family RNA polymerase sigma factor [Acidiferrobacteraceae bacterium]|nr:sigma-70 family RNA polymerase sigma factor [Acidiferrobacteraceae bacterium]
MSVLDFICRPIEFRRNLARNRKRLYRIAYSWTHNAALADDLVQDTMIKALRHQGQLREPEAQAAWLFTILANSYRDHFRRQRDMEDIDDLELAADATPETELADTQIQRKVRAAIIQLPEGQRQVVTLVDLEGFSYVEVAQILSIPSGTVMSRLCRGRQALRELLLPEFGRKEAGKAVVRRVK